jgi:hypothetical protein
MSNSKSRFAVAAFSAVLGLFLLMPAVGQGAVNFGSRLKNEPTETTCEPYGTCTIVSFIHPSDPEGDPYSGGAPVSGVITRFRVRAYAVDVPGQITFRIADINLPDPNNNDSALATAAGTGPTITIAPDEMAIETPITETLGRVPVKQGQHLAIDTTASIGADYNSNGSKFSYVYAPPLVDGSGARGSNESTNELLVAATIEPDADGDGFGDETQDQCSRQATTQGPCDDVQPRVKGLTVLANGKRIKYFLSENASIRFKLEKKAPGRRAGKRCVRQTPKNKKKKKCARFKRVGAQFSGPGGAGPHRIVLPNGRKLKPGRYRLTATARDAAGNESAKTTTFVVKKKKKKKRKSA